MAKVEVYSSALCPYCVRARQLLDRKGVSYQVIEVDREPGELTRMIQRSKRRTVPQIFINGQHVGGCDELYALDREGGLDPLLFAEP